MFVFALGGAVAGNLRGLLGRVLCHRFLGGVGEQIRGNVAFLPRPVAAGASTGSRGLTPPISSQVAEHCYELARRPSRHHRGPNSEQGDHVVASFRLVNIFERRAVRPDVS